jgi:hypothetical protein
MHPCIHTCIHAYTHSFTDRTIIFAYIAVTLGLSQPTRFLKLFLAPLLIRGFNVFTVTA